MDIYANTARSPKSSAYSFNFKSTSSTRSICDVPKFNMSEYSINEAASANTSKCQLLNKDSVTPKKVSVSLKSRKKLDSTHSVVDPNSSATRKLPYSKTISNVLAMSSSSNSSTNSPNTNANTNNTTSSNYNINLITFDPTERKYLTSSASDSVMKSNVAMMMQRGASGASKANHQKKRLLYDEDVEDEVKFWKANTRIQAIVSFSRLISLVSLNKL